MAGKGKKIKREVKVEEPKPEETKTVEVAESEKVEMTPENVLKILKKLGGKSVTTAQMAPYFKVSNGDKPWGKLRRIAKGLAQATMTADGEQPGKIIIEHGGKQTEYHYSLP